jgi:hypothetical protein
VVVRGLRSGISILCLLGMIALGFLVLIVQPMQQQLYVQPMRINIYPVDMSENVTMRVDLVSLEVFVFEFWHVFNDVVDWRKRG